MISWAQSLVRHVQVGLQPRTPAAQNAWPVRKASLLRAPGTPSASRVRSVRRAKCRAKPASIARRELQTRHREAPASTVRRGPSRTFPRARRVCCVRRGIRAGLLPTLAIRAASGPRIPRPAASVRRAILAISPMRSGRPSAWRAPSTRSPNSRARLYARPAPRERRRPSGRTSVSRRLRPRLLRCRRLRQGGSSSWPLESRFWGF